MDSDAESIVSIELDPDGEDNDNVSDNYSSEEVTANDFINDLELVDNLSDEEPDTSSDSDEIVEEIVDNNEEDDNGNHDLCADLDNLGNDTRSANEMHDVLNSDPEWTQDFLPIHVNQFIGPVGTEMGPEFDPAVATPLDYFQLYFSDNVFELICNNTNKYQKFRVQQKRITSPDYSEKFWYDTNLLEMKAYFGLAVVFGILNQRRYRSYWAKDPFLGNQGVQRVFSLKRYSKLSEYLHVSDRESEKNRGHPEYDKLGKVRWLYDLLNAKFRQYKHPEKEQTIDEMIMPFSGRISYIQYNVSDLDLDLDPPVTLTFTSTQPPTETAFTHPPSLSPPPLCHWHPDLTLT